MSAPPTGAPAAPWRRGIKKIWLVIAPVFALRATTGSLRYAKVGLPVEAAEQRRLERAKGFEPSTPTLATLRLQRSTAYKYRAFVARHYWSPNFSRDK